MHSQEKIALCKTLHGVFVEIYDKGILLTGPSGIGKSDCALSLLKRGHRLIADDIALFYPSGKHLFGICHPRLQN